MANTMSLLSFSPSGLGDLRPSQSPASPSLDYISTRGRPAALRASRPGNDASAPSNIPSHLSTLRNEASRERDAPEEGGKFNKSLQIDMKSMVGDSVGNMSISPTSRDIVLAARKGLFIIDLEAPLEVPRFLPQGGTWDVADVQWNPCPTHAEYIVSTSSERMLIWNLLLVGKTSIEFILQSHYRAITDINWHTFDPDLVCSTGIDSWIWAWDIRDPQKPAFGLCAFNAGGTQVKWNRKDSNILASSHLDEVLIWDRRKGSMPISRIKAHDAKIYGIDWSRSHRDQLITCSLDKTIKLWNINDQPCTDLEPVQTFHTEHPVWRARDLPFGRGVLSLPQRGNPILEMWNYGEALAPVEVFEGHADVVKEFVWRKRLTTGNEMNYQLITWSKDKTLRFWPIGREMMQKVGAQYEMTEKTHKLRHAEDWVSFRSPPIGAGHLPALSAPRGQRSILAGVRATPLSSQPNLVAAPHQGSAARSRHEMGRTDLAIDKAQRLIALQARNGTMTKGNAKGGRPRVDAATWLSSFRPESIGPSRLSSGSRPSSNAERDGSITRRRRRSTSHVRHEDGSRESATLLDEINAVVTKLGPAGVKLERHDLTKHRTCTFGIHGPWGESASVNVFVRVTFTFPVEYSTAKPPEGTPSVEIERSPLISVKRRAYMRKRLRDIREIQRPCLEACLRFLLLSDGVRRVPRASLGTGSSSEEDVQEDSSKGKDFSSSLIRDHPNLAEPRSSQGVFGPNGQLVCIFRSLPRVVKAVPQDLSATPAIPSRESDGIPRLFRSPLQLADAVSRLAVAANDHSYDFLDSRDPDDMENVLRVMNNLLAFSHPKAPNSESSRPKDTGQSNFSLLPKRTTIVHIKDRSFVTGAHRGLAAEYTLAGGDQTDVCKKNAKIARQHFRTDHERVFQSLAALFTRMRESTKHALGVAGRKSQEWLSRRAEFMVASLHERLSKSNDVQLLGMFSAIVLVYFRNQNPSDNREQKAGEIITHLTVTNSQPTEYFDLRRKRNTRSGSTFFYFAHGSPSPVSPTTPSMNVAQSLSSSSPSRGSWSSLFNADKVRHFIGSTQGHRPSPSGRTSSALQDKRITFVQPTTILPVTSGVLPCFGYGSLASELHRRLLAHVLAYAEMLHRWHFVQKRAELFNAIKIVDPMLGDPELDVVTICERCMLPLKDGLCPGCIHHSFPPCVICRTPIKGLSHSCIACSHVAHIKCWVSQHFAFCPSGCGCECASNCGD